MASCEHQVSSERPLRALNMPLGEHDALNALLMGDEPEHASLLCCRSRGVWLQQTCLETVGNNMNAGVLAHWICPQTLGQGFGDWCFALDAGNGSERSHPDA